MDSVIESEHADGISLKVGIVGAGIAGLITAIVLTEAGHDVEIFEKSRFANEVGAGIHTTPNSSRVLKHYGFDFAAARPSASGELTYLDSETGEVVNTMAYPDCEEIYGAPWYTYHRADLHGELKRHATEGRVPGAPPAKLRLSSLVKDVDTDGSIVLASGETIMKDLVVIAEGIHTALVEKVAEAPIELEASGRAMLRFLIPMDEVATDPRTKVFAEGSKRFLFCMKDERLFVSYPVRSGSFANCGIYIPDSGDWQDAWSKHSTKDELLKAVDGYHEAFVALSDKASDLSLWRLSTRKKPLETLYRGKLVLVGDALHPMLPNLGQGGAMAIEDAEALGVLLSALKSPQDISERLQLYQEVRKNRVCAMQLLSSHAIHGYPTVIEQARAYLGADTPNDSKEINDWCYRSDVRGDAEAALQQHLTASSAKS